MAKPKPPRIDLEKLQTFLDRFDENPGLLLFLLRIADLREIRQKKKLPDTAIAFELINVVVDSIDSGQVPPELWNQLIEDEGPSVSIPLRHLKPLSEGWARYTSGDKGISLSDALNITGKRAGHQQGARIADTVRTQRGDFAAAFKIEFLRAYWAEEGEDLALEKAIGEFARKLAEGRYWEKEGKKPPKDMERRLRRAYYARIDEVRAAIEMLGIPIKPPR